LLDIPFENAHAALAANPLSSAKIVDIDVGPLCRFGNGGTPIHIDFFLVRQKGNLKTAHMLSPSLLIPSQTTLHIALEALL
jgi:hypothetical protein